MDALSWEYFLAERSVAEGPAVFRSLGSLQLARIRARARAKTLLFWLFVLFLSGLSAVALAPLF